jgi:tetratricopeptide (TPR) repeat protein
MGTVGMSDLQSRAEELRREATTKVRAGEIEAALDLFDSALALTDDEEARELITINKADAMIAIERMGPEIQALPTIVMRRRNLRHVYLAAYALVFKYRMEKELNRATFYAQLAYQTADEANEPLWKVLALNELGSIADMDSKFTRAIECGEEAVALLELLGNREEHEFVRALTLENLGASKLLNDEFEEGVQLIEKALPSITAPIYKAEAFIDLCFGYLGMENLQRAAHFGAAALEGATEPRQVRNAHYLLGEVAYKTGDIELAEYHFEKLAAFYPDFRNLKSLLFAIDLRSMVNIKL